MLYGSPWTNVCNVGGGQPLNTSVVRGILSRNIVQVFKGESTFESCTCFYWNLWIYVTENDFFILTTHIKSNKKNSLIVKQAIFLYVNQAQILSWNQPVLSNEGKVSC